MVAKNNISAARGVNNWRLIAAIARHVLGKQLFWL